MEIILKLLKQYFKVIEKAFDKKILENVKINFQSQIKLWLEPPSDRLAKVKSPLTSYAVQTSFYYVSIFPVKLSFCLFNKLSNSLKTLKITIINFHQN